MMVEGFKNWLVARMVGHLEAAGPDLEPMRKTFLIHMMILLGNFFLAVLAAIALGERNFLLAGADLFVFAFLVLLFLYLRKTRHHDRVAWIGTLAIGLFYLFLVANGGVNNTASIWSLTYPLISVSLLGAVHGMTASLGLLASIGLVFALGDEVGFLTSYRTEFIVRFIPAYLTIFLFAMVMEGVRETIQSRLKTSNRRLKTAIAEVRKRTDELGRANRDLTAEIAERRRVEKALRDSESFLADIIESIQDGISVLDPDLKIRHTNSVMRKWYPSQMPLVGKKCYACYQNQPEPCDPCPTLRSLKSGNTEREVVYSLTGSEPRWLELYSYPIKNAHGSVVGVVEFVRDISERKRLENQLARTERMDSIGRLAGGIAHDFNNILMGIQGRTSLMLSDLSPGHPLAEHLESVEFYVKNASDLTGRLLGFARGGKYEVKVTDINAIVGDNLILFGRTKKELRIESNLQESLWPAEVDRGQISQVFLNLFVNAWEAMPHGGELAVSTANVNLEEPFAKTLGAAPGNYVAVAVADSGIGMDAETQKRIFDPFFTTKAGGKGTGLGLASAYGIVKNHGGVITVFSRPNRGTTFTVYLPSTDKSVREEKAIASEVRRGEGTILLVDDEKMILDIGSRMLEKLGYRVITAASGTQAVEIYSSDRQQIHAVVLDMIMPDQTGGETYDRLKRINREIKVLLSSGYSVEGQAAEILQRGCSGFIQKPFTMQELSCKMQEVLAGR